MIEIDPGKISVSVHQAEAMAHKMMIQENIVRGRLESGQPLNAQEVIEGVRLSHEEFIILVRAALPELSRIARGVE